MEHVHIYWHKSQAQDRRTQGLFGVWRLASLCVSITRSREEVKTCRMNASRHGVAAKVRQQPTEWQGRHHGKVMRQLERNVGSDPRRALDGTLVQDQSCVAIARVACHEEPSPAQNACASRVANDRRTARVVRS